MYTVLYNNIVTIKFMNQYETPQSNRPKRSMSYNDLKKKRLIRSSQSNKKINNVQSYSSTVKKRPASQVKAIVQSLPKDQKIIQNYILELKGVLGQIRDKTKSIGRSQSDNKRKLILKQNLTERSSLKNSLLEQNKQKPVWNKIIDPQSTKQLIKNVLFKNKNKNPSQRKLVKFSQIRDNFKKQKSLSVSKDNLLDLKKNKVKQIPSPLKNQTKLKYEKQSKFGDLTSRSTMRQLKPYIKVKQQISTQYNSLQNASQLKVIVPATQKNQQLKVKQIPIDEKFNSQFTIQDISMISPVQKSSKDNQSVFNILQNLDKKEQSCVQGSFLKLMNTEYNNLVKQNQPKEGKRRLQMQRIKRIFPKGFFDN